MHYRLLGEPEAVADGHVITVGRGKTAAVFTLLALNANRVVSRHALLEAIWPDEGVSAGRSLEVHVSRLRKMLDDGTAITSRGGGYHLATTPDAVDVVQFERLAARARRHLDQRDYDAVLDDVDGALALWHGRPLEGLEGYPFAVAEAARLDDVRVGVVEARIQAQLALGRHEAVIGELRDLVAAHPERESLSYNLMLALYRSGRQADALTVYTTTRHHLVDQLGIEPNRALQELQRRILDHDPALDSQDADAAPSPNARPTRDDASSLASRDPAVRTFLIADVRGYTQFTQERGDEAASELAARMAAVVREVVPRFDGELLELRGDEAVCVFVSARGAIRASVELQRRLRSGIAGEPGLPLGLGMGLDSGEAVPTEGGYRGGALNLAARLCTTAKAGQILASESAAHLAGRVDGVRLVDRRPVQLKGMVKPARFVEVLSDTPLPPLPEPQGVSGAGQRRVKRRRAVLVGAIVAVTAAVAAVFIGSSGGSAARLTLRRNGLVFVSASGSAHLVGPVGAAPSGVAVGGGHVWIVNRDEATLTSIDPQNGEARLIEVGSAPVAVAYGYGAVWVADSGAGAVDRVDPKIGRVVDTIPTGNGPQGVAVGDGSVWVSNSLDATVSRINPRNNRPSPPIPIGPDPTAIVYAAGYVWVANSTSNTLGRINARTGLAVPAVQLQSTPDALSVSGATVWVASDDGTVTRVDARSGRPIDTRRALAGADAIAATQNAAWVGSSYPGRLARLSPSGGGHVSLNLVPLALAAGRNGIWVAAGPPVASHRGGTLHLLAEFSPPDPLDPAISYSNQGWEILTMTNDGLTAFRRVGGAQGETVVPDLATTIPSPSDGGRTYTFQLRRGVRYSNGTPVRASDIRWGIQRTLAASSGGQGLYATIVGAAGCIRHPAPRRCDLSDGITTNNTARAVTFHLTRPDPEFPAKLALPFADAVPHTVGWPPPNWRMTDRRQPRPIPATGPYVIHSARLGFSKRAGHLVLVRNPYFREWSHSAQPAGYPDRIAFTFGTSPTGEIAAIIHGHADWTYDAPPSQTLARLEATRPSQIHENPQLSTAALFLNTRESPFTNLQARQAVNYAIDRSAIIRLGFSHGQARPTCQILPPGLIGYVPYCPYTRHTAATPPGTWLAQNRNKARALVRASGTRGMPVTLWLEAGAGERTIVGRVGGYVVSVLNGIGYDAHLRLVGVAQTPSTAQIGSIQWFDDYPAPSDFFEPLFSCPKGVLSSPFNHSHYCSHRLDDEMHMATAAQPRNQTTAANLWAAIDHQVTNLAPWVPLYTPTEVDVLSKRVGDYQYNLQGFIELDQLWVK